MQKLKYILLITLFISVSTHADVLIQFGGSTDDINDLNYQSQVGAAEIIRWWGGDSSGHTIAQTGELKNETAGATLYSVDYDLTLTSRMVSSSNASRTNTVTAGRAIGINAADGTATFNTADATAWTFDFDKDVTLQQLCFYAFSWASDEVTVTIDGSDYVFNAGQADTATWIGTSIDRVYTFSTPIEVPAGTDITITSSGSNDWGLSGVVVAVPEPTTVAVFSLGAIGIFIFRRLRIGS